MVKAIACVILLLGLLKFAQEAPELFKKLFSFGDGLFAGLDLDPRGQLKRQAEPGVKAITGAAKGIYRGAKGAVGGVTGGIAGAQAGGFMGGMRGLVAGGRAGANNPGLHGLVGNAQFAGAGVGKISDKNRQKFGDSNKMVTGFYDGVMANGKSDIEKQENIKKQLKANYEQQQASYINSRTTNDDYINNIINERHAADSEARLNQKVAEHAAANGVSEDVIRNNAHMMNALRTQAQQETNKISRDQALGIAHTQAKKEAEALYKADYDEAVKKADKEIIKKMGEQIAGKEDGIKEMFSRLQGQRSSWGKEVGDKFDAELSKQLTSDKLDADIANRINSILGSTVAGNGGSGKLDEASISKIMASHDNEVIAQVMQAYNKASKSTNNNISSYTTAQSVLNPAPPSGGSGSGGSGGSGGH